MAIIKKFSSKENLSKYGVFLNDTNPNSTYFRITELGENLTGGKNAFLIEGSECLKETTEIKVEVLDVNGNPIYFEPGQGIPQYYEGLSKVVGIYVYEDTPIGLGKITILGELKSYFDEDDNKVDVPEQWKGIYNVKWEKSLNINKNLANETRVRFFKKPQIDIQEISKPLFTKTIPIAVHTGSVEGIPQVPPTGQKYGSYAGGVLYKLVHSSGPLFTASMDENRILLPDLDWNPTIKEVLSETELLVDSAYTSSDGTVSGFGARTYTSSFENGEGVTVVESALTGSFAKIKITNLKTFVGDVARVKVFRKSRNEAGDFTLVQEQKLESTELLKDIATQADTELSYGLFNDYNLSNYWITSSNTHPVTLNNTQLLNSIKVDYAGSGTQLIYTSESIDVGSEIEYNLSFKTKLSGSVDTSKEINAYLSSSEFTQSIVTVSGSSDTLQKFDVNKNIISQNSGSARLVLEVNGDDWYISNISFKNAEESSFSPDEFTLVQEVPRKLDSEFFDFKFEFYDINNNFIPVDLKTSKEFSGGNLTTTSNVRLLEFETDRTAFRFSSGSLGNPPFQQSRFRVTSNGLTGSITFASAAFDKNGTFIDPSTYSGAYPGGLTSNNVLTIASFSGSDSSVIVGSITYTASIEDKEEIETITRFEDGEPASALIVTSNQNQFFYKATDLSVEPSGQQIQIQAQRKNLASDTTTITVNSGSGKPGLTQGSTVNGITSFTLNASDYPFGTGNTTYEFSGSDEFGSEFVDRISIAPVKKFDGVSLQLTNNNQTFNATSQSAVSSLADSSGSVTFRIGTELIQFQNGLSSNNRFDIAGITGSGCVPTSTTPSKNEYSLSAFDSDSGSLTINIDYKDGSGDVSEFQQVVNYTKAIAGNTGVDGQDGQDGADGTPGPPGPGVTYRGLWELNGEYVSSSLRRDVVQGSNGEYYLAKSSHTASNSNQRPVDGGSYTTYWDTFGATFSSVATDILFSQDVYANRTVNVGSSGSGYPLIALNADTANAGTNQDPYIALGGITQYAAANGIYLGYDSGDTKLSLKGGASDGFLTWDGSNLNIQGSINITGGATADSISALNSETSSLQTGVNNSVLSGSAAANNAVTSGSAAANNAVTSGSNAAANAATSASNAQSTANQALTSAQESGSVDPTTRRVTKNATPSGAGLYLGANNLGYYDSSNWKAYLNSSGEFYLGSNTDSNYLEWNGTNLSIAGSITITAGPTSEQLEQLNSATESLQTGVDNSVLSGSSAASDAQTNAQNFASTAASASAANASGSAIDSSTALLNTSASALQGNIDTAQSTANTATQSAANAQSTANSNAALIPNTSTGLIDFTPSPSGEGLFLGANELGFYSGSGWKTYMSSSGDFYLTGQGGGLTWNQTGSALTIQGRISGSQIQGGSIIGSSLAGGQIDVPNADAPLFHVDTAGNMSAQNVSISGSVNLDAGTIGGWTVDDEDSGGALRDSDTRIKFDPSLPEIQLYDSSGNRKVAIGPNENLTSPGSSDISVNNIGSQTNGTTVSSTTSGSYTSVASAFAQSNASSNFTIGSAGSWNITNLSISSTFTQTTTNIPSVTATVSSPAYNYYPSYLYDYHQGSAIGGTSYVYLYLSLYTSTNQLVHRETLTYSYARGAYNSGAYYYATANSYSPTGYVWTYGGGGSTVSATSYASSTYSDDFLINVENTGTHYFKYETNVVNRSSYKTDIDAYGNTSTSFSTFTKSGLNLTLGDPYVTLAAPSNFVEINAGGFQAVSDSSQYVRIRRVAQGTSNPNLMNVVGGYLTCGEYSDDHDITRQRNYGKTEIEGQLEVGDTWQSTGGVKRGIFLNGNINIKSNSSGFGGTSTSGIGASSSGNLGNSIKASGNFVVLNPSATRYYTLPCVYAGTEYADGNDWSNGDIIWIWNRNDSQTARIYGLIHGGLNSYYSLNGGAAMMCIYWTSFGSSWNSNTDKGWVIMSDPVDNTG
jgi:hypothetical protein